MNKDIARHMGVFRILLLLGLMMLAGGNQALAEGDHPLKPFQAEYRIWISKIPTPIKAHLLLRPVKKYPGYFQMVFKIDSWLAKNTEESVFAWRDCHPRTDHYSHQFDGFGHHRWHHMQFFWHPPHVVNKKENGKTDTYPIKDDTLDELTVLLTAGCALRDGKTEYKATTAYGDDLRHQDFEVINHETVDTPVGKVKTIVVEKKRDKDSQRRTLFWVAPSLNYMVVKAKHIENPALFGELIMTSYRGPGDGRNKKSSNQATQSASND